MATITQDCPFCATDASLLETSGASTIGGFCRWVSCPECHAQGPHASSRQNDQDQRATDADAIAKWNDQWALQYTPFQKAT